MDIKERRNIIITGASKGLGFAIAKKFISPGNRLLLCARNQLQLEEALQQLKQVSGDCEAEAFAADLSDEANVHAFAKWCLEFGAPSNLINNAGSFIPGSIAGETGDVLEKMMRVNVFSAYHLTRDLLPALLAAGSGHIFNMCSIASLKAYEGGGSYSISKYALHGFTTNLRHELKDKGIKVTGVFPGAVLTDSWGNFDNSNNRIMEATDIAEMVYACTLLSPQAVVEDIIMRPQLGDL